MSTIPSYLSLVEQKLERFAQLEPEFENCFPFVEEVHGQQRFPTFPPHEIVRYLHALYICECKDRLLSIAHTVERYEGSTCLQLLQNWQQGATSEVIEFLQRKLDGMPFAMLTAQLQQAQRAQPANDGLIGRLTHGRHILLNRLMNMTQAFDALFAYAEQDLLQEVQEACAHYGHQPQQIEQQMAEMQSPLYKGIPHKLLAQRNMLIMNKMGNRVLTRPMDLPGSRSKRVMVPQGPSSALAEHIISGYQDLTSPWYNNPAYSGKDGTPSVLAL